MIRSTTSVRRRSRFGLTRIPNLGARRGDRHRLRPGLLELEDRRLLATFTVTSTADSDATGTLRSAIAAANATTGANTIVFAPADFTTVQTITLGGGQLELTNTSGTLTIDGPTAGVTISAGGQSRVLDIEPGVTASISGLTFTGGESTQNGGGLYNSGTLTLTDCTISGNSAGSSGGGGLFNTGTADLSNCDLTGNSAGSGAGLQNQSGTMMLDSCTVSGNGSGNLSGGTDGGGLLNRGSLTLQNCTVTGNTGYNGGGLSNHAGSTAYLEDCSLNDNSAKYNGGLYNAGTASLVGCSVSNNVAFLDQGAVGNTGTLSITDCIASGNGAGIGCGGLDEGGGKATLIDCTISDNSAQVGGGIVVGGSGRAYLTGCTINNNSSSQDGAGVLGQGLANLTNCTVSGNSAAKDGGGIYDSGPMTLTACTISDNAAANGGGLYNRTGTVLTDTIIAGNTLANPSIASDIDGNVASTASSNNLIGLGGAGGLENGVNHNIVLPSLSTLGLAPLGFYGGPTETMALLPGSAAIHEGALVSGVTTDQRGEPLDSPPPPDIGAFQVQTSLIVNAATDGTGSTAGDLDLRQAVNLASALDAAATITFDPTVFDTAQTITLTHGPLVLSDTGGTLTITGTTSGLTISGGGDSSVFDVQSGVTTSIARLTITGGSASAGGGVYNQGSLTLTDCTISGNVASASGGGIGGDGTTTLIDCTVSGNSADNHGGGLAIGGIATLTQCTISGNDAGASGGGLYNGGTATLEDTIVARNLGNGGSPSDIAGASVATSSSCNLIGIGGSGGLTDATGNIVLSGSLASLGLATLGSYGGPTATMALLPGSLAIGAGTAVASISNDQRGAARPTSGAVDIGAFQDQGYALAISSGSGQSTTVGTAFGSSLVASLTENFAAAPLPGVTVTFSAPLTGASATLTPSSAVTDANGLASVTATANTIAGAYDVTASVANAAPATFALTNTIQPVFSGLSSSSATYGTTVTLAGTIAAGSQIPTGEVTVTVDGLSQNAPIGAGGFFSVQFTRADGILNANASGYAASYDYAGQGGFLPATDDSTELTITPQPLTIEAVTWSKTYDGTTQAVGAVPTIISGSLASGDSPVFTESFSTRNVGSGLALTPGGTVADNNGGDNYSYTWIPVSTGTITPAALTITATSDSRVYDGSTVSNQVPTYQVSGEPADTLYASDTLSGLTQVFASKDVLGAGRSTLEVEPGYVVNDGNGGANYTVSLVPASGTITPAALTITATSDSRVYNGSTVSNQVPTYQVRGEPADTLYGSDTLTALAQSFASKDVMGNGKSTLEVDAGFFVNDDNGGNDYTVTTVSASGTITPAPLTITATSDSRTYDGTTDSSLVPTYQVTGEAANTLYGTDTLTGLTQAFTSADVLGAGQSTLEVEPGYVVNDGNNGKDYTVTTAVAAGSIMPAELVITAENQTKLYGAALPALQAMYTGFVGSDTSADLSTLPTLATTATASSPVIPGGGYSITVSGAVDPNYDITYSSGTLTVDPAPLTITANDESKVYGAALPKLTASYRGLVNGDTAGSLATPPALSTIAMASSPVVTGDYPITVSGAVDANYDISYTPGTLTITPAPLIIMASSETKTYGASLPELTASYSGLVNGDTSASLATPPSLSTTATQFSPVVPGGYPITAAGAVDPNYTITYVTGTLTVVPAMPLVSVSAPGGTFDGTPMPATATLTVPGGSAPVTTLEGVSPALTYYAGSGTSGTNLGSAPPTAAGTYTVVATFPGSADFAPAQSSPATFTIAQAATTVVLDSPTRSAVYGQPVTLTATVTGPGAPTGSVSFSVGDVGLGTVALDSSGTATLVTSSLSVGSQPIVATYSGGTDFMAATSQAISVSVARDRTQVSLAIPSSKSKKRATITLEAIVNPLAPGAGVPSGAVTFEVMRKKKLKVLDVAPLNGGSVTIQVKSNTVLKMPVTVLYGGDSAFQPSTSTVTAPRGSMTRIRQSH